jgi:hypothetical protein
MVDAARNEDDFCCYKSRAFILEGMYASDKGKLVDEKGSAC